MNEPTREPPNASASGSVDFGYEQVPREREDARASAAVFDSVAGNYDLMNDLMSGGLHRLWKRFTLSQTGLRPGQQRARRRRRHRRSRRRAWRARSARPGSSCSPTSTRAMLARGRDRLLDRGSSRNVRFVHRERRAAAVSPTQLRLRDDRLRAAQRHRQARGARLDAPRAAARAAGCWCSSSRSRGRGAEAALRRLLVQRAAVARRRVAGDEASYRYLAESIRMHPGPGDAARHDARRRARGLPLPQPRGRHRRAASWAIGTER